MPEAVIVATARSPIGRAGKGSLVDVRPDDLSASIVKALLAKVPQLDPAEIEDLLMGCGLPAGEQGYNIARVTALLAGLDGVPGATVNRYCSSSLQTIRMAAHAIKAGEGDVFISAGVECVSRYGNGYADIGPHNPAFAEAEARTAEQSNGAASWAPANGLPDIYIAMGQTAENVRLSEGVSRQEMDEFAALSQNRAVASQESGFFEREIVPVELPDGRTVDKDDGPRPGTTVEKLAELKPVFRPDGEITAGNACPLNDGAAAVLVMSDAKAGELGVTPLARVVATGVTRPQPGDHGSRSDRGQPAGTRAGRAHDRRHRPRRDQRGVRGPGHPVGPPPRHRVGQAQRQRRVDRARSSVRHDRGPDHDHAAQRPAGRRRHLRTRDDVRRRRAGHGHDRRAPELTRPGLHGRPEPVHVTDPTDPRLVDYVGLRDPELRRRFETDHGIFIAEGVLAIRALLGSSYPVRSLLVTERQWAALDADVAAAGCAAPVYLADRAVLAAVAGFDLHRGAVAAAGRLPPADPAAVVAAAASSAVSVVAVVEAVNDHENLGALFRNAAAFGVGAVLLDPTCADPLYRRSVRVSLGHVLHVPFARLDPWPDRLDVLRRAGFEIVALTPSADAETIDSVAADHVDRDRRLAFLLGAEGPGLSAAGLDAADRRARIPMATGVDSLNVATAAAVAFHAARSARGQTSS